MNFLVVCPRIARGNQYVIFPIGLALISAVLKKENFSVHTLNLCHEVGEISDILGEIIKENEIDVLLTGGLSLHFNDIDDLLTSAKKIKPELITILGGAIVSSDPELVLTHLPVDIGTLFEGEETIVELAQALSTEQDVTKIAGTIHNQKGKIVTAPSRPAITDLDNLPMPDYEGMGFIHHLSRLKAANSWGYYTSISNEPRIGTVIASRSCPYRCTFCYHPLGQKYRQRSVESVMAEVDYLIANYQINIILFLDELFSADRGRFMAFSKELKKRNIHWVSQIRVTDVDEEILTTMKDSGGYITSFGIENPNEEILTSMKKKIRCADIEKSLTLTRKLKLGIQGNILFGDPAETTDTVKKSIKWWKKHMDWDLQLAMVLTIPDAPIYQLAKQKAIITDPLAHIKNEFPIVNLTEMNQSDFAELNAICHYYESYTNGRKLGKILSTTIEKSETPVQDTTWMTKIECPECKKQFEYRLEFTQGGIRLYCRHCLLRFTINPDQAFPERFTFIKKLLLPLKRWLYGTRVVRHYIINREKKLFLQE